MHLLKEKKYLKKLPSMQRVKIGYCMAWISVSVYAGVGVVQEQVLQPEGPDGRAVPETRGRRLPAHPDT